MHQAENASDCRSAGVVPPVVPTLMASKDKPATEAWIAFPDCRLVRVPTRIHQDIDGPAVSLRALEDDFAGFERVESVPSDLEGLHIQYVNLTGPVDLTNAKRLRIVEILNSIPTSELTLELPDSVNYLFLNDPRLASIKNIGLPPGLTELHLPGCNLRTVDFEIPSKIKLLNLGGNPLTSLERINFPDSIDYLMLSQTFVTIVRGCKFPSSLRTLVMEGPTITTFEIRESDVKIFSSLETAFVKISVTSCSDPTARLTKIGTWSVCVISDIRFDELYSGPVSDSSDSSEAGSMPDISTSTPPPTFTTTKTPSTIPTAPPTLPSVPPTPPASTTSLPQVKVTAEPTKSPNILSEPTVKPATYRPTTAPIPAPRSNGRDPTLPSSAPSSPSPSSTDSSISLQSSSLTRTTMVVTASVFAVLTLLFILLLCRRRRRRIASAKSSHSTTSDYTSLNDESADTAIGFLPNDVRGDPILIALRLTNDEIVPQRTLATTPSSVVTLASYRGRAVAVKRLTIQHDTETARFMAEIRIAASLDHDKIAAFVGIAWSSDTDLASVVAYMPGGDLETAIRTHSADSSTTTHWLMRWGPPRTRFKSKLAIASDVAEALVYLHSFQAPIVHGSLRAKEVLLDESGGAKLSTTAVSREMALDRVVASEIGAVAWLAPEFLRGGPMTDKGDVYAFGVLLVELDRHEHPIAEHIREGGESKTNTSLALEIQEGSLRPTVRPDCPTDVAELAKECLAEDPNDRPTAMEVSYRLRVARRQLEGP